MPQPMDDLDSFNAAIGRPADIYLWYRHLDQSLDTDIADGVLARGAILQLSWIPTPGTLPFDPTLYQQRDFTAGIIDGATSSRCGTPGPSLGADAVYRDSYSDYIGEVLTTDFDLNNTGAVDACRLSISAGSSSNGTELLTTLPVTVGNVSAGTTAHAVLKYKVPPGVYQYVSWLYLSAEDSCGNVYSSPAKNTGA